jgi:hypothetical protein
MITIAETAYAMTSTAVVRVEIAISMLSGAMIWQGISVDIRHHLYRRIANLATARPGH